MSEANERQVGGDHYKTGGTELWDLFGPESIIFYAVRYVQRWRDKAGVVDLEKAVHCVQKLREIAPKFEMRNVLTQHDEVFELWLINAVKGAEEQTIIRRLVTQWKDDIELEYAQRQIEYLIRKENQVKVSLEEIANFGPAVIVGKAKLYKDMTVAELMIERARLEKANEDAPGWGAAVGARHEDIREIESELILRQPRSERTVPRYDQASVSFTPWLYDGGERINIETDLFNRFYTKRAAGLWVLDPHVVSTNIPNVLRHCYTVRGDGNWTLDLRKCPAEVRDYFPDLRLSLNMKEWEELPEWQRVLYTWDEMDTKYKLAEINRAWHVEEV